MSQRIYIYIYVYIYISEIEESLGKRSLIRKINTRAGTVPNKYFDTLSLLDYTEEEEMEWQYCMTYSIFT